MINYVNDTGDGFHAVTIWEGKEYVGETATPPVIPTPDER